MGGTIDPHCTDPPSITGRTVIIPILKLRDSISPISILRLTPLRRGDARLMPRAVFGSLASCDILRYDIPELPQVSRAIPDLFFVRLSGVPGVISLNTCAFFH